MLDARRTKLADIKRFDQLIAYLRDEMDWPIAGDDFENLTFEYTPEELGIDRKSAASIQEIKRLRPLSPKQPWGIFFVKFEPKRLPVVALRRILSQVALKKRASANSVERAAWAADDLLFVSNYGEGDERQITFAHFSPGQDGHDLPTLKVLGWNNLDTELHLDDVVRELTEQLSWPVDDSDVEAWRKRWRAAFTLRHREAITTSKDLSIQLAKLARAIRDRIKTTLAIETASGPLSRLMKAFREALIHDLDADRFADMYAQTVAYGLLSARIADPHSKTADDFAAHMRTNPFLRELMEMFLQIGGRRGNLGGPGIDFDELGVSEVVELLDDANMEAIVRDFGDRNPQEDPVIHFYEHFLAAYDKKQKVSRGVFYTPRPVVSYIVRSVDELLRTEFDLEDGLADTTTWGEMEKHHKDLKIPAGISPDQDFVQILDPATGTGTFLVEAIDVIHKTLVAKWKGQGHDDKQIMVLWNEYVPRHLLTRLHAYELLMAPYAIAHLKVGLKLYATGYRFGSDERARIYLTNALEPASDTQLTLDLLPALAHEAQAVNEVKRNRRFTVVMGNPPYAGHSLNNQVRWIVDKVYDYKRGLPELHKPGQAKWLQDDYVKFIRLAEEHLAAGPLGILGYITNNGYLDNPTFKGMRRHLLESFAAISLFDLHGSTKKKDVAPDGRPDENVFDIQQGVAILLARRLCSPVRVDHRDLLGSRESKYSWMLSNSHQARGTIHIEPKPALFLFRPRNELLADEYAAFPSLTDCMSENGDPAPGVVTTQDEFAISWSPQDVADKIDLFLATRTEAEARQLFRLCTQSQWNYAKAKSALASGAWRSQIVRILYRPFDWRWTVYNPHVAVHLRHRVMRHMLAGDNIAISTTQSVEIGQFEHVFCSGDIIGHHTVSVKEVNFLFPLWLSRDESELEFETGRRPNLGPAFVENLSFSLDLEQTGPYGLPRTVAAEDVFGYVYACLHSPRYRSRYREFLRSGFPRVPLAHKRDLFRDMATYGRELVGLHLMRSTKLEYVSAPYEGPESPVVGRPAWFDQTVWLDGGPIVPGHSASSGAGRFHRVPEAVWEFHIGGYRVCEKWLKDRKGRNLSEEDIAHYQRIVVAVAETIRVMKEIDAVIEQHGGWPAAFEMPTRKAGALPMAAESPADYRSDSKGEISETVQPKRRRLAFPDRP